MSLQDRAAIKPKKYMVFVVLNERFAVPLSHVKEVIGLSNITSVPNMPSYFTGLVNLRGKIVSAIDMKSRLNIFRSQNLIDQSSKRPCIIITEFSSTYFGAIVDDIVEVISLSEENFDRSIEESIFSGKDGVVAAAKMQDRPLTLVLDLHTILNINELIQLANHIKNNQIAA